ncbi:MAG: hypothetical protein ACTTJJ_06385 [Prevotella fusca]|uniref:hypothetical protein n=1 Tax=Prevotella fusca TaxID=589436 RepID=UPI003FA05451
MQFNVVCKHCHRPFVIESGPGSTLRCNCPYCGEGMMVATPHMEVTAGSVAETAATESHEEVEKDNTNEQTNPVKTQKTSKGGLGKKVTIVFVVLLAGVILLSSLLYIIFSAMSN